MYFQVWDELTYPLQTFGSGWIIPSHTLVGTYPCGDVGIDNVFASGVVVGRATKREWARQSLRGQRGAGRPHAKTWSISIQLDHLGRSNQTV